MFIEEITTPKGQFQIWHEIFGRYDGRSPGTKLIANSCGVTPCLGNTMFIGQVWITKTGSNERNYVERECVYELVAADLLQVISTLQEWKLDIDEDLW